jgi:hypothetical protein
LESAIVAKKKINKTSLFTMDEDHARIHWTGQQHYQSALGRVSSVLQSIINGNVVMGTLNLQSKVPTTVYDMSWDEANNVANWLWTYIQAEMEKYDALKRYNFHLEVKHKWNHQYATVEFIYSPVMDVPLPRSNEPVDYEQ